MKLVKVTHPNLDGVHEVPERALRHWGRVGWEPVTEAEEPAPSPAAPDTPAPEPDKTTPRRRRTSKESE